MMALIRQLLCMPLYDHKGLAVAYAKGSELFGLKMQTCCMSAECWCMASLQGLLLQALTFASCTGCRWSTPGREACQADVKARTMARLDRPAGGLGCQAHPTSSPKCNLKQFQACVNDMAWTCIWISQDKHCIMRLFCMSVLMPKLLSHELPASP